MSNDAWGTSSGFKSDYEIEVTNSYWSPPTDKNPNWSLVWDGIDLDEDEEKERLAMFGAGKDWASFDGGETVDHPEGNETKQGKTRQFHTNSGVGQLIETLIDQLDTETLNGLPSPRNANVWVGSKWYMEEVKNSFTNREGNKVNTSKVLPTKLVSWGDGSGSSSGGSGDSDSSGLFDPELVEKIRQLAIGSEDHGSFMNQAIAVDGVATNDKLVIAISSEEFYRKLVDGENV